MKKKLISYKESAHPYYDIKDYEGDTGVNYVQYQKSQRSLARCILYSLIILIGLALCGFGLAVWWKDTQFCNKKITDDTSSFSFANYYGSHMVLQRAPSRANVWGWAKQSDIGSQVSVIIKNSATHYDNKVYISAVQAGPVSGSAVWQVLLDPVDGSHNAYTISAVLGSQSIEINDILFGDVWVCSGQSNMQFTVNQMFNGSDELAIAANYPHIRLFDVAMITSATPQYELLDIALHWTLPNADTLKGFSAVCWLYGKEVHKNIGIPMGLILSCWGGTRVEAWSSPDALKQCSGSNSVKFEEPNISDMSNPSILQAEGLPSLWKEYEVMDSYPSGLQQLDGNNAPDPNENSVLWNAMIHPLLNLTITGALWYQGEANVGYRMNQYNCTFRAMINDWRKKFNEFSLYQTSDKFPFGFVQLGTNDKSTASKTDGMSDIRWHQTADIGFVPNSRLQNVFMGTAFDVTDFGGGIHPRDKITPAHRLALAGLAVAYGQSSVHYRGPTPTSFNADYEKYTLKIEFDWSQGSDYIIDVRAKFGFDVCCSLDGKTGCSLSGTDWTEVNIVDFSEFTVTVSWQACQGLHLMGFRYAWRESPCPYLACPIYGSTTKLPMTPFIYQGLIIDQKIIRF